ncbi:MAG: dihydropteroate synthase [Actinomycetota bacterium]|nr:dihydropteroate synthase [Actinomycetota bacterium]
MAIVNRTPDSFFDDGRTFGLEAAVRAALAAEADGADMVDVGGVPFGRGPVVSTQEELDRVVPVISAVSAESGIVISVDTTSATVARESIAAGASIINDTSGLFDPDMAEVVAASSATLVLTHSLWPPRSEPVRPEYDDVALEVVSFLRSRIFIAQDAGIPIDRLIVDPGHDLNKNTFHTLELTRRLDEVTRLGPPTLVAVSNKDFIGETLDREKQDRLEGTIATAVFCILKGARIVRMHDVPATVAAVRMTEALLGFREPAYARHNLE